MKLLRFFTLAITTVAAFGFFFCTPTTQAAGDYGLQATADRAQLTQYGSSVPVLAGSIIGTALSMISVIFFILMIYGGFLWMTAHGDDAMVKKAQDTITAAIIGIIVILAAYAITNYITTSVVAGPAPAAPLPPVTQL